MEDLYKKNINERDRTGKRRFLPDPNLKKNLRLDFSSNDYFGFSKHPDLIETFYKAGQNYGVGGTGSRLLSGNHALFDDFEATLARDKHTQAALVFNSGYQANLSVLSALCDAQVLGKNPLLFFDRLNHASLYQAAFLSKAQLVRYRHLDLGHLQDLLSDFKKDSRPKIIVTETLFGMDGDVVDLQGLVEIAKAHQAMVYLDEAHATGLLGPKGYGLSSTVCLNEIPHVVMGTFSKALGSFGAYVACSETIKDYLINGCSGFIYTTALPPAVVATAFKAWQLLPHQMHMRDQLFQNAQQLRFFLKFRGFDVGQSITPIIPIILQCEEKTLATQEHFLKRGIRVSAIRPPTVPPGTSRIRIALTIKHKKAGLQTLQEAFETI